MQFHCLHLKKFLTEDNLVAIITYIFLPQARIGRYIIKNYRKNATKEDIQNGNNVTFREFVHYLIHEGSSSDMTNEHWTPIHQLCHPCTLNYSFIGKYEKLEEDSKIVLNMIGAPSITFPRSRPSQTFERLKHYLQQLSMDDIIKLYRVYEVDFKLFGYNLENILGYDIG